MARLPTIVLFGRGGAGAGFLGAGWSTAEEEHTWTAGKQSNLRLPIPSGAGDLYIDFTVEPFVAGEPHPSQHLTVFASGKQRLSERFQWKKCLGIRIEESDCIGNNDVDVDFFCQDAIRPSELGIGQDTRQLGVALYEVRLWRESNSKPFYRHRRGPTLIRINKPAEADAAAIAITHLTVPELVLRFESLGRHCEFGLVQRMCATEPLGLLRFAGLPYGCLLHALRNGFSGIDSEADLDVELDESGGEWMVFNRRYDIHYHTFLPPSQIDAATLREQQRRTIRYRRDKLIEILATGEKLLVVRDPQGITEASARPLLNILRGYGPNYLLFVSDQTGNPPGTVEALSPHLFMGSLDGIAIGADEREIVGRATWLSDAAMSAWLSICAHTYRLWREDGGGCN